ncbi:MAG: hypothetical protein MHPSP_000949 [Paramarteilia canceri]
MIDLLLLSADSDRSHCKRSRSAEKKSSSKNKPTKFGHSILDCDFNGSRFETKSDAKPVVYIKKSDVDLIRKLITSISESKSVDGGNFSNETSNESKYLRTKSTVRSQSSQTEDIFVFLA